MITVYKIRKSAEARWVRQRHEWAQPNPKTLKTIEGETRFSRLIRQPFGPLVELLTCEVNSLAEAGAKVMRWLDDQPSMQDSLLCLLAVRSNSDSLAGQPIGDHNRIATIEILARYGHWSAPQLVTRYLSQPIREYHLYALPLVRLQQIARSQNAGSIAQEVVRLYGQSITFRPIPRWQERFTVEVFRTLADISPAEVVGSLAPHIANIGDLELTSVLESVCQAARRSDHGALSQGPLGVTLAQVWDRYVADRSTNDIGNRPGIMGRLAELLGRTGADLNSLFSVLEGHPLRMQVLYQFTRRPLDFAPSEHRFRWYMDVMKLMTKEKQSLAFKRFLTEVVVPDLDPELQTEIVRRLARSLQERPSDSRRAKSEDR
jgi:hypothetical protein